MQALLALCKARGATLSRDELTLFRRSDAAHGGDALERIVIELRRHCRDARVRLQTVPGAGFRLVSARPAPPIWRWLGVVIILLAAISVVGGGIFWRFKDGGGEPAVVTVLPFADHSPAHDQAYFADGVAEDILGDLTRQPRLKILGRASAAALRERKGDLGYLRDKLGVTALLEGSFRVAAGRVRIEARLIDTRDGTERWFESYDRPGGDIFAVQDEIAKAVVARLSGGAAGYPSQTPARRRTASPEAYRGYLLARQLIRTRQPAAIERAQALMEAATLIDPNYAPAWALLGESTALLASNALGTVPTAKAVRQAEAAIARALMLEPDLPDTYLAKGVLANVRGVDGLAEVERAAALDPQSAETLVLLANLRLSAHAPDGVQRAIAEASRATELDPLWFRPVLARIRAYSVAGRLDLIPPIVAHFREIAPSPVDGLKVELAGAVATNDKESTARLYERARKLGVADALGFNADSEPPRTDAKPAERTTPASPR
jgi:TolB-like protein